jgi:YcaO-like protein with predicted kinase domain
MAEDLRIGANGKGSTRVEAVASAYCELVERISIGMICGVFLAPYRQLYGPAHKAINDVEQFRYMPGYKWAHQDALPNPVRVEDFLKEHKFTNGQLDSLKMKSDFLRHWVPGYSLVHNKEVQVPVLFTKWISSTNGIAAGNTMEEAIVHACCEIFERDALIKYLRRMNTVPSKTIIQKSIKDERILDILDYFKRNNVEVLIKDIGFDTYPVYNILTFNHNMPNDRLGHNFVKSGSAFSSKEALMRCFTERMQGSSFETEKEMEADRIVEIDQKYMPIMFSGICPFQLGPYNTKENEVEFEEWAINDTKVEIDECINIARRLGTDLIVVDHTHPVFNLPTCRVVMPGVSDFMKWWDQTKLTIDFIGNILPQEDLYEEKLIHLLKSFCRESINGSSAKNKSRRDT